MSHGKAYREGRSRIDREHAYSPLEAIRLLKDVEGVGHVAFTKDDVVRHELVARIVEAYDNATAKRETGQ